MNHPISSSGYSTLFELLPIGAYRSSPGGRQWRANAALVRLNGYASEAEMLAAVNDIGREWYVDAGQRQRFAQLIERDGQVVNFVSEIYRHKTRERIWIRENAHLVRDAQGKVLFFEGTVEDITQMRLAQCALEASEQRFRALTEMAQGLTLVCNAQGDIGYASPAAQSLLGIEPAALQGTNVFDWLHPDDVPKARLDHAGVVASESSGRESIHRFRHVDGSVRELAALANNCLADPAVQGIVLHLRDVTERVRAEEAVQRLADHDPLTDLPNRRCLMQRMNHAITASTTRSGRKHALFFIDLDHFKALNDSLGHDVGDLLLQQVAQRLRASVRAVDTVSRLGGDEFVVLLQDLDASADVSAGQALKVAEKMLAVLARPYTLGPHTHDSTACIGITLFGDKPEGVGDVLKRADIAMYRAKNAGRNSLRFD